MPIRFETFNQQFNQDSFAYRTYHRVATQPSWVTKVALIAATLVVVIPLILLALAATLVGVCVFFFLSLVNRIASFFKPNPANTSTASEPPVERKNVRVIQHPTQQNP